MKAVAVASESCVLSSVRTNFLELALHQSACYLLATIVKKRAAKYIYGAAIRELHSHSSRFKLIMWSATEL